MSSSYRLRSLTGVDELSAPGVPLELAFVMALMPVARARFAALCEQGYGIGVRTVETTPSDVLAAVDQISHHTQHNTVIPWLPRLLRDEVLPQFSVEELEIAARQHLDLYAAVQVIFSHRFEFKKIVVTDLKNQGVDDETRAFLDEANRVLYPFAIDYIVNRILFDNAHTRTEAAQSLIKALLIVGPVAHGLEHWARGIGKLFAASADDILSEIAELLALRGSGFSWRVLSRRSIVLIPIFALATWGTLSIDRLMEMGHVAMAGMVFGLSAVCLSLTTAIQSIFLYHAAYKRLASEGKLSDSSGSLWRLALRQDFTNPARLGLCIGACVAPCAAAIVFIGFPSFVHNGWVLALLGSVESVVASMTVFAAARLNGWMFRRQVKKTIGF